MMPAWGSWAAALNEARLKPHPALIAYPKKFRDPTYCPLCGFFLLDELDSHFVPCLVTRSGNVWREARP